ncbi:hypothetical protein [Pseudomonas fluorescens]|uniref:Uncharacterized protein n=1 Tax=Pseudomonas fluorescens TaxID=294 RepID=A0A944HGB5_PSEFL|nr:hypothetical protein [Pseudomonas fluorescens]MBT2295616.1 hypothetical protein [Pseudomonas fluorescens]MBT2310484.1 hypothetical protein [Pseudomonas fluorescens]MBT2313992.1 hypothetical protein [Pseudomonas fluorescens]MBT2318708.1 hypothetical protein [Pseudomonas fluorescens]MBT2329514.1 hypothetical protein [Pseudomonas fluorescens]
MNTIPSPEYTRGSPHTARVLQTFLSGVLMAKMAIFLGGFLALTLLIGVLATISPV